MTTTDDVEVIRLPMACIHGEGEDHWKKSK